MSGIGGWVEGPGALSGDRVLALLGCELTGSSGLPVQSSESGRTALAVSGPPLAAFLLTSGIHRIAIVGHPRWTAGARSETALDQICRAFLDAYKARGRAALETLQGDFALAIIDAESNEAFFAIDRFGIRNLVYQADEHGLIFGSTCDVVRKHPQADHEVDPQAIYDYTYFHAVPGPKTIFRKIKRLLPGHCITWSHGKYTDSSYWSMTFPEQAGSVTDFKPPFRRALMDAVTRAANGTDSGAFLSGGTDSSTVAGLLGAVTGAPAKTYSIGFAVPGYDEMEYAKIASRHFGTEHHEYYVTPEDVVNALPAIAAAYDQPFGNASAVAAYYCARMAKSDGISRLLAGDGGDEIFGGNSRYAKQYQLAFYEKLPASIRRFIEPLLLSASAPAGFPLLLKARSYIEQASRPMPARYDSYNLIDRLGPQNLFTPDFLASVNRDAPLKLMRDTYENFSRASLINQMLGIDLKFTLADSDLPKVTRMCELAGVEVVFPLLDEDVVELSGRLPANLKLRGTQLRYFFKEALRDFLPGEVLRKQKHGFGLPVGISLTHPGLMALAGDCLSSLKARGIIAPEFIERLLGEHLRTHAAYYGTMAWVLMMLELWFQKHQSAAT